MDGVLSYCGEEIVAEWSHCVSRDMWTRILLKVKTKELYCPFCGKLFGKIFASLVCHTMAQKCNASASASASRNPILTLACPLQGCPFVMTSVTFSTHLSNTKRYHGVHARATDAEWECARIAGKEHVRMLAEMGTKRLKAQSERLWRVFPLGLTQAQLSSELVRKLAQTAPTLHSERRSDHQYTFSANVSTQTSAYTSPCRDTWENNWMLHEVLSGWPVSIAALTVAACTDSSVRAAATLGKARGDHENEGQESCERSVTTGQLHLNERVGLILTFVTRVAPSIVETMTASDTQMTLHDFVRLPISHTESVCLLPPSSDAQEGHAVAKALPTVYACTINFPTVLLHLRAQPSSTNNYLCSEESLVLRFSDRLSLPNWLPAELCTLKSERERFDAACDLFTRFIQVDDNSESAGPVPLTSGAPTPTTEPLQRLEQDISEFNIDMVATRRRFEQMQCDPAWQHVLQIASEMYETWRKHRHVSEMN